MKFATNVLALASAASFVQAATYSRTDSIVGSDFLSKFTFEAIADPTNGRVNYVDKATAKADNLTYASGNTFIMRADDKKVLTASGPGRDSVRIKSAKTYTTHVVVFDIKHMPAGCGTWPAVWETDESNWPNGGEIDIVEGINNESPNQSTLHTSPGCTMPANRAMSGTAQQLDCNTAVNNNAGCGVLTTTPNNFGPAFNNNGGGYYAMERTNSFLKVWFWQRGGANVPPNVSSGADSINTDNWGTPTAYFPNTDCDIASHFDANNIIINLTFCGDWAGADYPSTCPSTCIDHVNNDPSSFSNAYFNFQSLNIYE